jgi:predicted nuclease of restriction endonuclease-like RecB superfamily
MNVFISSEGEKFIGEFLEENNFDFKREVKLIKLKGDYASYRIADFYLPKFKVYIEFLGKWNEDKQRKKYNKKRKIYQENKIPCVYIYPDNLGTINWLFKRRLKSVLKKHHMKWQLLKLNYKNFIEEKDNIGFIILGYLVYKIDNNIAKFILLFLLILGLYHSIKENFLE